MLSPSLLVHYLAWAWVTLILEASLHMADIKNSEVYSGFQSTSCCWESGNWQNPAGCSSTDPWQTELSIYSTSFTIWYVVYCQAWYIARAMAALYLTLRDSEKCIVSSVHPERLWRWPWEYSDLISHSLPKQCGAIGALIKVVCVCVCVCHYEMGSKWRRLKHHRRGRGSWCFIRVQLCSWDMLETDILDTSNAAVLICPIVYRYPTLILRWDHTSVYWKEE